MMNKSSVTCLNDLIGVQFEYGGRGPDSYDCWGCVRVCYKRWHGVELPDYPSSADPQANAVIMSREGKRLWKKLPEVSPGSVILIRIGSFGAHVAFAETRTQMIHALDGWDVRRERIERYKRQILGAYEYVR